MTVLSFENSLDPAYMQGRHLQLRILSGVYIPKNLAKSCYPKWKKVE